MISNILLKGLCYFLFAIGFMLLGAVCQEARVNANEREIIDTINASVPASLDDPKPLSQNHPIITQ